eukprot:362018-Chlamydomonas_euryale.AAC.15
MSNSRTSQRHQAVSRECTRIYAAVSPGIHGAPGRSRSRSCPPLPPRSSSGSLSSGPAPDAGTPGSTVMRRSPAHGGAPCVDSLGESPAGLASTHGEPPRRDHTPLPRIEPPGESPRRCTERLRERSLMRSDTMRCMGADVMTTTPDTMRVPPSALGGSIGLWKMVASHKKENTTCKEWAHAGCGLVEGGSRHRSGEGWRFAAARKEGSRNKQCPEVSCIPSLQAGSALPQQQA